MKSVFLFLCFVVLTLTSQGQNFPRLDLSDNGHVIELDGDEYYFLMRARVDRTFDAREAIFQINDWLEARSYMWLFAVDFEMKSSSDLEGFFVFEVQPNQGSDMRRCVFPSLLSNGYLEIHQYPPGIIPREYTLGGDCSCYYPGRIVKLTLNGSEEGVDYELLRGGIKVSTLSGTGGALTFRATNAGTYTVRAVRGEVSRSMNGSVKLNESPVFGGRLSLVNPNPVVIPPDGGHAEIPFSFTGSASEIIPLLQEVAVSCCSGESSYWNSSFLFACGQTGTNTGKFIVVAGPNLSDTDLESRFVLDTQATYGILELVQPNGGMLRVADVRGGGEIASGSTATVSLSAQQPLVLYRLYCNDSLVTEQSGGTFTGLTAYGHYRIQAAYDGHEAWMNGSVGVWPAITRYTTGGGGVQTNSRPVEITLSGSEPGLTYRLLCGNTVVSTLSGTGSALRFSVSSPGVYRIEAGLQDYYVAMSGSAEVCLNTTVGYSPSHSYTVARTYLTASGDTWRESVRYSDGLGRPLQDVQVSASPDGGSDLIQPYVYGRGGRVEKSFLPYAGLGNLGNFDAGFSAASNWSVYGASEQSYAFSVTEYDGSPSNRVTKQTGPGSAWHAAGKGVTTAYGYNGADEVRLYRVSSDGGLVRSGYYAAGRLEKTTVTDEDGLVTESFTDNGGKTVLTVSLNGTDRLETYSVYDALGRVRWVLPPEASHRLGAGTDTTVLNRYAYRYDYDPRGLLIEKRLPGVDPVYYVYDGKDRAVLSQDGNQRSGNRWSYTLYDSRNRATETGEVVLAGKTATQLRSEAGSSLDYLPSGTRTALQYCLYDSYTASPTVTPHAFVATPGYATAYHPLVTGQLTATKTRILGSDTWQTTTLYYDDLGRVIQTVGDNRLGGLSRTDMQYDFTGNLTHQRESHGKTGGSADVLESVNTYDAQGRLLTQSVSLNGGTAATLTYSYDALGRLTGKRYGSTDESLTYNVRGWLTGKESTPFRMRLRYAIPEGGSGARWNGSLSEWEWQHGTNAAMMYGLTYDGLNRFTGAVQKQKNGNTWSALSGDYVEKGLTYDRNGNLLTLQRTAGGSVVDNLAYTYTGNQLTGLSESVRTAPSNDIYAPGNAESGSYGYDANGNLQNDSRKSLNFSYNFLNLVSEVRTGGTVTAAYTWLADGTKLGVRNGSGSDGFEYAGSLIYRKSGGSLQLSEALFGNGVIRLNDNGTQEVNYFLTDHLGSVRVIVDGAGTVKECNDYYPFGARHIRSDYAQSTNRWKYNGKELQTTGELGYLDYGARMYDAGLGRWFCADPEAESRFVLTPYHYCSNNPLLLVDKDGKWDTHYIDQYNNVILQTDDGSDDVVRVPAERMSEFLSVLKASRWDPARLNSRGWNDYWKGEFGLADIQFSAEELFALDMFNSKWSRNAAAAYLLKPTLENAFKMGFSEGLSQWTNPELVVTGLSAGIAGLQGMSNCIIKGRKSFFDGTKYTEKVLGQMKKGDFHGFPESVTAFESNGFITTIKGGDGIVREMLKIPGGYKGRKGFFEFIKEFDGTINHRLFNAEL